LTDTESNSSGNKNNCYNSTSLWSCYDDLSVMIPQACERQACEVYQTTSEHGVSQAC
jgi:hypothetical protein